MKPIGDRSNWPLSLIGVALLIGAASALVLSWIGVFELAEANLLTASGGAMALGLILVAASLFARMLEAREARGLDAEFALAEQELRLALKHAEDLRRRFNAAGAKVAEKT